MKNYLGLLFAVSVFLSALGCGDSDEATSVMDGADPSAVEAYEAAIAAEEAEMDANPAGVGDSAE